MCCTESRWLHEAVGIYYPGADLGAVIPWSTLVLGNEFGPLQNTVTALMAGQYL